MRVRTQLDGGRVVALVDTRGRTQFVSAATAKEGLAWRKTGKGATDWSLVPILRPLQFLSYRKAATTRPHRPPLRLVYSRVDLPTNASFEQAVRTMGAVWERDDVTILVGPTDARQSVT